MNFLTCPIDSIGTWLTGAAWFQIIKWPFWFFLILVAFGGVYTAIFKKTTLLCRGITGALKLAMIYLFCFGVYRVFPSCMEFATTLPLITLTDQTLTLNNPMNLFSHPFSELPRTLVTLWGLLLCVNFGSHLDYGGRNKLPWLGCQVLTCVVAMLFYCGLAKFIGLALDMLAGLFPPIINLYFIFTALLLFVPLGILMTLKYIYIVFRRAGSPTYTKVMQFLCSQHFGSIPFVTFFSELVVLVFLVVINAADRAVMPLAQFNATAYVLTMLMCGATLLVYSMYYTERKWGG